MNEKTIGVLGTLGTIILGIFAAAIALFAGGNALQGKTREVVKQMFNFELVILVFGIVTGFIPVVGTIIGGVIFIVNLLVAIKAYLALGSEAEFKLPIPEIIK